MKTKIITQRRPKSDASPVYPWLVDYPSEPSKQ
jgi:hypothetical protein